MEDALNHLHTLEFYLQELGTVSVLASLNSAASRVRAATMCFDSLAFSSTWFRARSVLSVEACGHLSRSSTAVSSTILSCIRRQPLVAVFELSNHRTDSWPKVIAW